jgi:cell division protein FtsN
MNEHEAHSGEINVELDNRKIILAFVVLIAICGGFFVLGFMEGKRQGYQAGMQTATEIGTTKSSAATRAQLSEPKTVHESEPSKSDTEDQPLNWYQNVNRREEEPKIAPRATKESSPVASAKAKSAAKSPSKPKTASSLVAESISYTVQVGAFVKKEEAAIRGKELQAKGFDYRIEPPVPPDKFYYVKVGNFDTRAEAVATQLRLKESGFSCFIKSN